MMLKQITLAVFTTLFVITGAGMASAESGVSTAVGDEGSSAALQADWAATHGYAMAPAGTRAYGQAHHRVAIHKARPDREAMGHNG